MKRAEQAEKSARFGMFCHLSRPLTIAFMHLDLVYVNQVYLYEIPENIPTI